MRLLFPLRFGKSLFRLLCAQPELRLLLAGLGGGVFCHGCVWHVDSSVPDQSSDGPKDYGGVHRGDLQQQGQVRPHARVAGGCVGAGQLRRFYTAPLISSLIFGGITCVTGLLGVVIGAATTRLCRQKTERADPLVCAVSMLGSAIFICLIFVVAKKSIVGAYVRASCRQRFWLGGDRGSPPETAPTSAKLKRHGRNDP